MSERLWLVDRTVTEKPSLINHVYATPDGDRYHLIERSAGGSTNVADSTAAITVEERELATVDDPAMESEYAAEARRMASRHDPDDTI